jgi:hypothetical protein
MTPQKRLKQVRDEGTGAYVHLKREDFLVCLILEAQNKDGSLIHES